MQIAPYDVYFADGLIRILNACGNPQELTFLSPLTVRRTDGSHIWWDTTVLDADVILRWADRNALQVSPEVREYAQTLWAVQSQRVVRATAEGLGGRTMPGVRGLQAELMDTQKAVIASSPDARVNIPGSNINHRAIMLCDDQGLGKSLTALAILRVFGHESNRAVIVCPSSLTLNWVAEMRKFFKVGTFSPHIAKGRTHSGVPGGIDVLVIGWEILSYWVDAIEDWQPDAFVYDEGQYAKSGKQVTEIAWRARKEGGKILRDANGQVLREKTKVKVSGSSRGDAVLRLCENVAGRNGLIMPMTGTPILNRPIEVWPLIEATGIAPYFVSEQQFKERYCAPTKKGGFTSYNGASHLTELNTKLMTSGVFFRRTKELLVRKGLLQKKYVDKVYAYDYGSKPRPWMITPSPDEYQLYREMLAKTQKYLKGRLQAIAQEKQSTADSLVVQKAFGRESNKNLKAVAEMRRLCAEIKIPHIVKQVQELNARGEKVVIIAHHRDIVDAYEEQLGAVKIQGGAGADKIEMAKKRFNEDPDCMVMVLSIEAGKTGHTLCLQRLNGSGLECAYMIFAEQTWSPGDEAQAQDRIWRIGQTREVHIANALLRESFDEQMYSQRLAKRHVFNAVADGIEVDTSTKSLEKQGDTLLMNQLAFGEDIS